MVAPMPRAAPVTTATLPASGLSQSAGRGRVGGAHAVHLPVDVGRLGREDEPEGGLQAGGAGLGVGGQVDQRRGGAALQLLAQRAGEALQSTLSDLGVDAACFVRSGADDDHAGARREVAQHRGEELVELLEPGGVGDAGGVEHHATEGIGPATADVVGHHVVVPGQRGAEGFDDAATAGGAGNRAGVADQ